MSDGTPNRTSTITIANQLSEPLLRDDSTRIKRGAWQADAGPPDRVDPGATSASVILKPADNDPNTEAIVAYRVGTMKGPLVTVRWKCADSNGVGCESEWPAHALPFEARAGGGTAVRNRVPKGDGLIIDFTVALRISTIVAGSQPFPVVALDGQTPVGPVWAANDGTPGGEPTTNPVLFTGPPRRHVPVRR